MKSRKRGFHGRASMVTSPRIEPISEETLRAFPALAESDFIGHSNPSPDYNCAAFTLGFKNKWRWPDQQGRWVSHAPLGQSDKISVEVLIRAYESVGFQACDNGEFEPGCKKIAIYVGVNGIAEHVAMQRPDRPAGRWFSKLGSGHDIEHDLYALEGDEYGRVHGVFLKRQVRRARRRAERIGGSDRCRPRP